ncbi:MAG: hypothetical protein PHC66_01110 [Candidatus Nanoarchaeia archaeon]|nr:hypothetical protein [Candidatus Nanoarchaeia archaeon]MDD5239094.1 hypothetical protein [Candidatus Nanoarchaeia archaeon]
MNLNRIANEENVGPYQRVSNDMELFLKSLVGLYKQHIHGEITHDELKQMRARIYQDFDFSESPYLTGDG